MLNLDNIARDYDEMEEIVRNDYGCMAKRYVFYGGYNWYADDKLKMFDFADGDYIFTIRQDKDCKPCLDNKFSVMVGTDEIEFERS